MTRQEDNERKVRSIDPANEVERYYKSLGICMDEIVDCSNCHGLGLVMVNEVYVDCPKCKGKGTVENEYL